MTNIAQTKETAKYSFHQNGFWLHITVTGNIGIDQWGDRWYLRKGKLYAEFGSKIFDTEMSEEPKQEREWFTEDDLMERRAV